MTLLARIAGLSSARAGILAVVLGVTVGLLTVINPLIPIALAAAAVGILFAIYAPAYSVPVVFVSILLESVGALNTSLAGLPITLSKVAVLGSIGVWTARAAIERRPLLEWLPITSGMVAVLASMIVGIGVAGKLGPHQFGTTFGVVMVFILTHLIAQLLPVERITWLLRIIAAVLVMLLLSQVSSAPVESVFEERYTGAFLDPNMWATTLLLVVPISFAILAGEKKRRWTVVLLILGLLFPLNIFQSLSRSGLLATILITPFLIGLIGKKRWLFLVILPLIPLFIGFFVSTEALSDRYLSMIDPTMTEADGSIQHRSQLAKTAWLLFTENIFIGIGQGSFIEEGLARTNGSSYMIAHNTYLTVAAELGLYGLLAHGYFFFLSIRQIGRAFFRAKSQRLQRIVAGYATSMIGFATMSATLNNMTFAMAFFMMGVFMAIDRATYLSPEDLRKIDLGDPDEAATELDDALTAAIPLKRA